MVLTPALALLLLGFTVAQGYPMKAFLNESSEETDNSFENDYFTVSDIIERANKNVGQILDEHLVISGDIIKHNGFQNADPCTANTCKWPKHTDGKVYIPYYIGNEYSPDERAKIENALKSFQQSTCIVFHPWRGEQDYIYVVSQYGCFSSVGRQSRGQYLYLQRPGCVDRGVIQHEFLHALGFHHEHQRSDRDKHVQIVYQNIQPNFKYAFDIHNTNNLGTQYDYGSVMHYKKNFFAINEYSPTIIPIPDRNAEIGYATEMSKTDILRVNKLYCTSS